MLIQPTTSSVCSFQTDGRSRGSKPFNIECSVLRSYIPTQVGVRCCLTRRRQRDLAIFHAIQASAASILIWSSAGREGLDRPR
ncbi:hypothetical protein CLAIMM_04111 [Cladophialophora immunda]|nr:hypothetical protein CLAIMM_04111 [Cladophialophora immunda]